MSKGLTLTLAAVATAWLGVQAFAMAPVIDQIPSPIISDGTAQTDANVFVYPDALDLDSYVNDPDGTDAGIQWTHWSQSGRYIFNGAQPLDLGTDSPITPPAAKVINKNETLTASGEVNPDGDATTATARDQKLSPLTGNPTDTAGAATGIIREELVTFFASDGNAVTSDTVWVYTENDGTDRLSTDGGGTPPVQVYHEAFTAGTAGWAQLDNPIENATTQYANQKLCITLGLTGNNLAQWGSAYGLINLAANSVYRVRLDMTTNQTTARGVPFWDFIFQNIESTGNPPRGDYAYAADYLFLDNVESNNAIKGPANGRNVFYCWFTPAPVLTPQWNSATSGAFTTANDPNNDFRMVFRSIDADSAGILAEQDSGQICLDEITVDKFDLANMTEVSTLVSLTTFQGGTDAGSSAANGVRKRDVIGNADGGSSTVTFPNGGETMRVVPGRSEGWKVELTFLTPGDNNDPNIASGNYGNGAASMDNYPIPWNSDQLYMMRVVAKAPNQAGVDDGPDAIRLGFEAKTLELLGDQYAITGLGRAGAPKLEAAPYVFFYWTHTKTTLTNPPQAAFLKWKLDIFNTDTYNRPTVENVYNQGGVDFESIEVLSVSFPGM